MRSTSPDSWGSFIVGFLECPPAAPGIAVPHPPARPRAVSLPPASLLARREIFLPIAIFPSGAAHLGHLGLIVASVPVRSPTPRQCALAACITESTPASIGLRSGQGRQTGPTYHGGSRRGRPPAPRIRPIGTDRLRNQGKENRNSTPSPAHGPQRRIISWQNPSHEPSSPSARLFNIGYFARHAGSRPSVQAYGDGIKSEYTPRSPGNKGVERNFLDFSRGVGLSWAFVVGRSANRGDRDQASAVIPGFHPGSSTIASPLRCGGCQGCFSRVVLRLVAGSSHDIRRG